MLRKSLALISALALTVLFTLPAQALEVGEKAPCVVLEGVTPEGGEVFGCIREVIDPAHTHTILDFFSITCGTCKKNLPSMSKLTTELAASATVRFVSIDRSVEAVKAFLADPQYKTYIKGPVAFDAELVGKKAFGVAKTPTMFILDKSYTVVYKHTGALSADDLEHIKKIVLGGE